MKFRLAHAEHADRSAHVAADQAIAHLSFLMARTEHTLAAVAAKVCHKEANDSYQICL